MKTIKEYGVLLWVGLFFIVFFVVLHGCTVSLPKAIFTNDHLYCEMNTDFMFYGKTGGLCCGIEKKLFVGDMVEVLSMEKKISKGQWINVYAIRVSKATGYIPVSKCNLLKGE